jgi:hypothetical protein
MNSLLTAELKGLAMFDFDFDKFSDVDSATTYSSKNATTYDSKNATTYSSTISDITKQMEYLNPDPMPVP